VKTRLSLILLFYLPIGLVSCQTKPLKIVFVSNQQDTATELNQTKIYKLKKKATNADFDYSKLNNIDENIKDTLNLRNLMPIFNPIDGQYNYFQFIATFKGKAYNGGDGPILIKDFHDILIIKTDNKNEIIDAFQYTLEWAEMPCQYDLFKSSSKKLILADNLEIASFKFIRTDYWDEKDKFHRDGGLIKLK